MNRSMTGKTLGDHLHKQALKRKQLQQTVDQDSEGVTVRVATITCGCGWERSIMLMYQCLYCGVWFCENCAEIHFGKTRDQHNAGTTQQRNRNGSN